MNIYRENIMDHYKNPRNEGMIENPDFHIKENNPLCGDKIELYIKMSGASIEDVKFLSEGCAISKASASIVSENVKGFSKSKICSMSLDDVKRLLGIPLTPSRVKCAMLGLDAMKKVFGCS